MKWITDEVPSDYDEMYLVEIELSDGSHEYHLCIIDDNGMMADPESGDDIGKEKKTNDSLAALWDYECITKWIPLSTILTWLDEDE